jgi:hypothetical protein
MGMMLSTISTFHTQIVGTCNPHQGNNRQQQADSLQRSYVGSGDTTQPGFKNPAAVQAPLHAHSDAAVGLRVLLPCPRQHNSKHFTNALNIGIYQICILRQHRL